MNQANALPYDMKVEIVRPDQLVAVMHAEAKLGWVVSGGLEEGAAKPYQKMEGMLTITFLRPSPDKMQE